VVFLRGSNVLALDCAGNDANNSDEDGWEWCDDDVATAWHGTLEEALVEWSYKHSEENNSTEPPKN
jgi:hypothetical protein